MHRVRPLPKKRKNTDNEKPCDFCNEFYIYIQKLFLNT